MGRFSATNALSPSRPASATPTPTAAPVAQAAAPSFLPAPSKVYAQVANVPTTTAAGVALPTRPAFNAPPPLHAQLTYTSTVEVSLLVDIADNIEIEQQL